MAFSLYSAALALIVARGWHTPTQKLSKVGAALASVGSFLRVVGFVGVVLGLAIAKFAIRGVLFCATGHGRVGEEVALQCTTA